MDQKGTRVFVKSVVGHLHKSIKSYDDTRPEIIISLIEDHLNVIKMASGMCTTPKKKKSKKKHVRVSLPNCVVDHGKLISPVDTASK
jgi:hypothetical protein